MVSSQGRGKVSFRGVLFPRSRDLENKGEKKKKKEKKNDRADCRLFYNFETFIFLFDIDGDMRTMSYELVTQGDQFYKTNDILKR